MDKISEEFARILEKRIRRALEKAKYYPATVDINAAAREVVRPYIEGSKDANRPQDS